VSFTWPLALLFGLSIPLVLGVYLWALRRRRRQAVTYSSLALLRTVLPRRSRWRRHVPIALLLVALAVLTVASARPQITSDVAVGKTTIILAIDESGSMCSTDLKPNRLGAAQNAARTFVNAQPSGVRMGLVVFSNFAELAVAPTRSRSALDKGINNLSANAGTAIGAAILQSLQAISQVDPKVQPVGSAASTAASDPSTGTGSGAGAAGTAKPGAHGYAPDIVVLLTDGSNTQGISPLAAVPYAVARGVRVYTVGLGTTHPGELVCSAEQLGGNTGEGGFGSGFYGGGYGGGGGSGFGGGGFGGRSPLVADLPMLRQVSKLTGGISYTAPNASQLDKVLAALPKDVTVQKERHEITDLFAAIGAFLIVGTIAASIKWSPYP
jgi:Ca-activated chloride channel homolog